MVSEEQSTTQRVRRRASRAAGPAKADASSDAVSLDKSPTESSTAPETAVVREKNESTAKRAKRSVRPDKESKALPKSPLKGLRPPRPPRRRRPNGRAVGLVAAPVALLLIAGLAWGAIVLVLQHRAADARQAREQRFVDTATQTVVNMFSYTQDNIDESVNRFVNGTSGPLRSKFGSDNVAFLKELFHKTNATSEAVINGAALENIDTVSDNASVLVAVRVTVADIDGVNKPSQPYRLRVVVHEDERGRMTGYDLTYPDGGN